MKKQIMIAIIVLFSFGCSKQECPKFPEASCSQCWQSVKDFSYEKVATTSVFLAEGTSAFLELLKKSEIYLQEKIEEWRENNPGLVVEGEAQLKAIREKINELEKKYAGRF